MPESQSIPVCYRHPDRQTRISCSVCDRPICTDCTVQAPVGQRCPEHAKPDKDARVISAQEMMRPRAPFTYGMIAVCVAIFVVGFLGIDGQLPFIYGAQHNPSVAAGEYWRLLTAALLHGGIVHIFFNMYVLSIFGPPLERDAGTPAFATMYLACAAAGGAAYYVSGTGVAVGASGAIFGLFGAWLVVSWRSRHSAAGNAQLRQLGILLAINLALPLLVPRIAWQAHLGGLIAGALIAWAWLPTLGPRGAGAGRRVAIALAVLAVSFAAVVMLPMGVLLG